MPGNKFKSNKKLSFHQPTKTAAICSNLGAMPAWVNFNLDCSSKLISRLWKSDWKLNRFPFCWSISLRSIPNDRLVVSWLAPILFAWLDSNVICWLCCVCDNCEALDTLPFQWLSRTPLLETTTATWTCSIELEAAQLYAARYRFSCMGSSFLGLGSTLICLVSPLPRLKFASTLLGSSLLATQSLSLVSKVVPWVHRHTRSRGNGNLSPASRSSGMSCSRGGLHRCCCAGQTPPPPPSPRLGAEIRFHKAQQCHSCGLPFMHDSASLHWACAWLCCTTSSIAIVC